MYKYLLHLLLPTALFSLNTSLYEAGSTLYFAKGCANCHGTQAEGSASYPPLANKPQQELIKKLHNFKKGIATSHKQEIMFGFAKALSKEDIEKLAYFLANYRQEDNDKYEVSDDILGSMD